MESFSENALPLFGETGELEKIFLLISYPTKYYCSHLAMIVGVLGPEPVRVLSVSVSAELLLVSGVLGMVSNW